MDAFLNVTQKIQAYGDQNINSNPRLKYVDWSRDASGIPVSNPKSQGYTVDPGATKLIFDGTRSTTIANDTEFDVSLSSLDPSRYRITWSGGTNPNFRVDRNLTLDTIAVTFTVQLNNSVIVSVPSLASSDFTGVLPGDIILIPNVTTGDPASPISVLNGGLWQVLGVQDSKNLTLVRLAGVDFEAVSETQTLTSDIQFQAFSASGVQIGDSVDISMGFAAVTQRTFEVAYVSSNYIEIVSTLPLPAQTGITPTAAGMIFYTDAKSFLYVEADQECAIRLNGSTDNSQRISPVEASNKDRPGVYMKRGPSWSLTVVNRSSVSLNLLVIDAG